jgi:hypothetical protein
MAFSRPGVYVSERDLPTPVTSVGTANAAGACIGYFPKGPETVTRVASWYEFATTYGDLNSLYPATYGVSQFFQNGGGELYVRRVTSNATASAAVTAAVARFETSAGITGVTGTQATVGSTTITYSGTVTAVTVGMGISAPGIPYGTTILTKNTADTTFTISQPITAALSSTALNFVGPSTSSSGAVAAGVTGITGTATISTNTVTAVGTITSLVPGMGISGTGIPTGTTILSISSQVITISANVTAALSATALTFTGATAASLSGTVGLGTVSPAITGSGTTTALTLAGGSTAALSYLTPGMGISGTNIAAGTYIAAIGSTAVTLSQAPTGTVSGTMTFSNPATTRFVSKYKGTDANLLRVQISPVISSTLTATQISYSSNVVTVTVANSLVPGQLVTLAATGFTSVVEIPVASASATQFTLNVAVSGSPATVTTSTTGADRSVTVYGDYWNVIVAKETVFNQSPDTFADDLVLETYNNVVFNNKLSSDYIGTVLSLRSEYIKVEEPTTGVFLGSYRPAYTTPLTFTGGADGSAPLAADYTGTSNAVLKEFDVLERPLVVFAPELGNQITSSFTEANVQTVQNAITSWAGDNGKAFVVLDTQSGKTPATAITYTNALTASSNAAMYYPNFYVPDLKAQSANALRLVGPAGAVAGLILATDRAVGPHKSTAGISAKLAGAVALEYAFTSTELDNLNVATNPVNAIRNLPGAGIVVMGGRTLKASSSISKYVSTRRSLFYIKRQMEVLTQFALFENNSEVLWSRIRTTLTAFLNEYRNQGGLRGATIDQSFYIKVDAENNDATSIAAGNVNVEVGVALERPAEFIVITLSQMTTI